jgi:hypothetical protein
MCAKAGPLAGSERGCRYGLMELGSLLPPKEGLEMLMHTSADVFTGPGYRLSFQFQPDYLQVRLSEGAAPNVETMRSYWALIAERVHQLQATQLLVLDDMPGEVLSDAGMELFFQGIEALGLKDTRIAYVKQRVDMAMRMEEVEQQALELGYYVRMTANESDARLWLSYGE